MQQADINIFAFLLVLSCSKNSGSVLLRMEKQLSKSTVNEVMSLWLIVFADSFVFWGSQLMNQLAPSGSCYNPSAD